MIAMKTILADMLDAHRSYPMKTAQDERFFPGREEFKKKIQLCVVRSVFAMVGIFT